MTPEVTPRNPLRNYTFRVAVLSMGEAMSTSVPYIAGLRSVSGLRAQIAPTETWEGGNNLHRYANPGRVMWEPITLEQGLALDSTLEDWARTVIDFATTGKVSVYSGAVKRTVIVDVWDENSHPSGPPDLATRPGAPSPTSELDRPFETSFPVVAIGEPGPRYKRFHIFNAWISKYQALPKLDSMTSEVALGSIELMHEGWVESTI